jgi:hypothetical protein
VLLSIDNASIFFFIYLYWFLPNIFIKKQKILSLKKFLAQNNKSCYRFLKQDF